MALNHIDHYLVYACDLEESKRFYTEVLCLRLGYRPPFSFPGYWLYSKDKPLVHLAAKKDTSNISKETGALAHIAFNADDLEGTIAHLQKLDIEMQHRTVPEEGGAHQIFIKDPDGIKIELNFSKAMP